LTRQRDFSKAFDQLYGIECATDCQRSLNRFLRIELLDETTRSLVDDVITTNGTAWPEGAMSQAPSTLHRVVLDKPNSDTPGQVVDWQRVHFVLDWSTGDPLIALIHAHGWTP
jgi:hypothetical protein